MQITYVRSAARARCSAASSSGIVLHVLGERAERRRVRGEVDARRAVRALHAVVEQVVERRAAARLLQPVDAAVAAVVEHDDDRASCPSITDVAISELSIR